MNNVRPAYLLAVVAALFLALLVCKPDRIVNNVDVRLIRNTCPSTIDLEIQYQGSGMVFPRGEILYVRLCDNHVVYYDDIVKSSSRICHHSRKITALEYQQTLEIIQSSSFDALNNEYSSPGRTVDSYLRLTLVYPRHSNGTTRRIVVNNIIRSCQEAFPEVIRKLICKVDEVRQSRLKVSRNCNCAT